MASVENSSASCPCCGTKASGNFCSSCGASLFGGAKSSLEDLPVVGDPIGLARTFWRITRSPVMEPVRIASAASDKSPYKFLIGGIGIFIGFFFSMEALAGAWGVEGFTLEQRQFLSIAKYAIVIHLAVAAVVVYAAFAVFAGRKVQAVTHARLWALLGGYYLTAEALLLISVVVIYAIVFFALPGMAPAVLSTMSMLLVPAFVGVMLVMLVNLVVAHARQWAKPLWASALVFAVALVATPMIARPLQYAIGYGMGAMARALGVQSLFGIQL